MNARRLGPIAGALALIVAGCTSSAGSTAPSVAPSSAVGSTSSPSPVPSADPALVTAFLEHVRDPGARYRVDQTLEVVVGQASSKATSHSDVSGEDRLIVTDSTVGGETTHTESLQVDGEAYERRGDEDWRAVGPAEALPQPFPFLQASDMRYAGRQIEGGEFLESFSLGQAIPIGGGVAETLGVTGGTASVVLFDCFLLRDGSPVRVEVGLQLSAADGSAAGYSTIEQDYSEFGDEIVVEPPVG
jgi:hypothetical protein